MMNSYFDYTATSVSLQWTWDFLYYTSKELWQCIRSIHLVRIWAARDQELIKETSTLWWERFYYIWKMFAFSSCTKSPHQVRHKLRIWHTDKKKMPNERKQFTHVKSLTDYLLRLCILVVDAFLMPINSS